MNMANRIKRLLLNYYNTVRLLAKIKKITRATMDKLLAEFDDAKTRMMLLVIKNEEQD